MFHHLHADNWQRTLSIASFTIFAFVFLLTLIRVARMPRKRVNHLEQLPLENDTHEQPR
jgi:hypothetical protein